METEEMFKTSVAETYDLPDNFQSTIY